MSSTTSGILNLRTALFPQIRTRVKNGFKTGKTRDIQFRKQQLLALTYLIKDNMVLFQRALASDLGRSDLETIVYVSRPP